MGCLVHFLNNQSVQDPRQMFASYRDNGSPKNEFHERIQLLAGHIHRIIALIDDSRWNDASNAIFEQAVAQKCGLHIDSPFRICQNDDDAVSFARKNAMWYKHKMKLRLPQVAIGTKGSTDFDWEYPEDLPLLAQRILPIWLEEWIHVFQHFIAGPVSQKTVAFKESPGFLQSWDENEVDIFVIFKDLGWDEDMMLENEKCYDERIAFAKMDKTRKIQCCGYPFAL
jgi:hypothetical protein